MWENKTDDGGLRDKDHIYSWYNTDSKNNGGASGFTNNGTCSSGTGCDTQKYVTDVNAMNSSAGLCGYTNWRMPTVDELQSIADMGRFNPAIDTIYFPKTVSLKYWSSSNDNVYYDAALYIDFDSGRDGDAGKAHGLALRLVRSQ
jgi:hypothetical protein